MSDEPFLELRDLAKSFGEVTVLEGLTLQLAEGELLALLGPSGSGKTTALRLLAGFEQPDRGEIRIRGQDVVSLAPARRGIGMVFQHYALFPHMTVNENVAFGLKAQGWKTEAVASRVETVLELVDMAHLGGRRVGEISGGQQQRVALARALAPKPRVLLLDEPLSNLDPSLRDRTRRELKAAVRQIGITTVLVTHEQEEAFQIGDRVAVLHRGILEQVGRPEELYASPRSRFVARFVGRASVLPGTLEERLGGEAKVRLSGSSDAVSWIGMQGSEALEQGQLVDLVVRPEALRLVDAELPGALAGEVSERRYTGPLTYVSVRLESGGEVEVLADGGVDRGQRVFVAHRGSGPPPLIFVREEPVS